MQHRYHRRQRTGIIQSIPPFSRIDTDTPPMAYTIASDSLATAPVPGAAASITHTFLRRKLYHTWPAAPAVPRQYAVTRQRGNTAARQVNSKDILPLCNQQTRGIEANRDR